MSNVDRGWRFYSMRNELRPREEFSFPKWSGMRIERLHAKALVAPKDAENGGNNFNKKRRTLKFLFTDNRWRAFISSSVVHSE